MYSHSKIGRTALYSVCRIGDSNYMKEDENRRRTRGLNVYSSIVKRKAHSSNLNIACQKLKPRKSNFAHMSEFLQRIARHPVIIVDTLLDIDLMGETDIRNDNNNDKKCR